jgi:hypothetical protein
MLNMLLSVMQEKENPDMYGNELWSDHVLSNMLRSVCYSLNGSVAPISYTCTVFILSRGHTYELSSPPILQLGLQIIVCYLLYVFIQVLKYR